MKENLLIKLENKTQIKVWRNVSIFLFCILLIFIFQKFKRNKFENENIHSDFIAEINLEDEIVNNDYRDKKIKDLINNKSVKAVILNIDSPGGMVTPSEILYDLIYKLNKEKPVVVLMNSMATSGAYMVALGSDYLIARNTTLTGSIGVILQSYEVVDLAKKVGVELKAFKSSDLKGMPSLFEKNNEQSNKAIYAMIDDVYNYFFELVKNRRNISEDNLKIATNGEAFTGRQALNIGLIDEIGDIDSALNYLKSQNIDIDLPIINIPLIEKKESLIDKIISFVYFKINGNNLKKIHNKNNLFLIYN